MTSEKKPRKLSRRDFLRYSALTGAGLVAASCAAPTPQVIEKEKIVTKEVEKVVTKEVEKVVTATPAKPNETVLVYWTVDGDEEAIIQVSAEYEADFGVPIRWERTPNIEEFMQKVLTMTVAGEQMDVFPMHFFNIAKWTQEGIVQPVDGLPGLSEYLSMMSPGARSMLTYDSKVWGFPYQLTLLSQFYNTVLWEKANIPELPKSWPEMAEVAKKLKADGIAEFPIVYQAGVGSEHIGETWYHLVASEGGTVFDKDSNLLLEPGSKAREMLQFWRDTIQEWKVADPRSLELRWIPAAKAMATGNYVFCNAQPRFMRFANLPDLSPTAGQHKLFRCGTPMSHGLLWAMGATAGDKAYAWDMLKYFGAQTKDGKWLLPVERAKLSYASGWPAKAADDPGVNELWSKVWDIDEYKSQFAEAPFVGDIVPAMRTLWYLQWVEQILVPNLQDCLGGRITVDQAVDNLVKGAEALKKEG